MATNRVPPHAGSFLLKDDTQLMRYLPFPRFLALLEGKLSFTPIRLLRSINDPLESQPITDPHVIVSDLTELKDGGTAALEELRRYAPEWVRQRLDDPQTNANHKTNYYARTYQDFIDSHRAVSCWFANGIESAAMWTSFARNGVAIKTDLKSLENVLPADSEFLVAAVRYRNRERFGIHSGNFQQFPHIKMRPYLVKGLEFDHEKEVRIVTRCNRRQKWFSIQVPKVKECIHSVIISPYMDRDSARALKALIQSLLGAGSEEKVVFSSITKLLFEQAEVEESFDRLADSHLPPNDPLPL